MIIPDWLAGALVKGAFTLGGASIGVFGALWVKRKTTATKKLSILVSPQAKMLDVGDVVKSRIKILYESKPIENLFMGQFALQNSGTLAIEGLNADFRSAPGTQLLNFQVHSANFSLPQKRLYIIEKAGGLDIRVSFLNRGERITFQYTSTGSDKNPIIDASQPGVDIDLQSEMVNWIPDIYAEVLFELISEIWVMDLLLRKTKVYQLYLESKKSRRLKNSPKALPLPPTLKA